MPGGDRTGPAGMGPMTGRAAGFCAGYSAPGYANPVGGRGMGMGRGFRGGGFGRGRGFGRGFGWAGSGYAMPAYSGAPFVQGLTAQQELDDLRGHAKYLGDTLDEIKKRMEQLDKETKK